MIDFFKEFNNREIAIFIWVSIVLVYALWGKSVRKSLSGLFKIFFSLKMQIVFVPLFLYITFLVWLLAKFRLWDFSLLKDTIFWSFGIAFLLIFRVTKNVDNQFFKETVIESFKWTILLEFIANFYTFSLPIELLLTLLMIFFSMMQPLAEAKEEHKDARKFINTSLSIIGLVVILFSSYKTVTHLKDFFTWSNAKSILLSPILTLMYIPFIYLMAILFHYENLFIKLKFMAWNNRPFGKFLKLQTFLTARFNLSKINNIQSNILKHELYQAGDVKAYLKEISSSEYQLPG